MASLSQYYEQLIRKRQANVPDEISPATHGVNWADAPSKLTIFQGVARVPLFPHLNSAKLNESIGCNDRKDRARVPRASLEVVSDLLLLGAGILGRRVDLNWNGQTPESSRHTKALYSRGPASGGGLYPTEIYLISQNVGGLPSGVYHYDNAHHALARLRTGNYQWMLKDACNHPSVESADFLIIVTARFWKNLFKYYNFAFQVVTQDAGCLSDCIQQTAWLLGLSTTTLYWFRDSSFVEILGLESDEEAVCAVIAVRGAEASQSGRGRRNPGTTQFPGPLPRMSHTRYERSRHVFLPELLREVHRETLVNGEQRPPVDRLPEWEAGNAENLTSFELGRGCSMPSGFVAALMERGSSWGRFRCHPRLSWNDLSNLLCFLNCSARHATDAYTLPRGPSAVRVCLIARNVSGLPPGAYDHDPCRGQLLPITASQIDSQLQKAYFLENYNLDQVAAILVVVGRLQPVLASWGSRGLRIMNAEAGMVAQRCYTAASALGLGCGAALGLDATQINRAVGVDGENESSILLIFIGHQVPSAYAYDFRLY
jgi:SagB-type dehydrogenase family enzyme